MRILKMALKALTLFSLVAYIGTGKVLVAIFLLVFSSMVLGILIGEKIEGKSK